MFAYFDDKMSLEEAKEKIKTNTRRFAKRQMTWFKKDKEIRWFDPSQKGLINNLLEYISDNK